MSRVAINTGSVANDGTGTSLRIAGGIINDNFSEIYSQFGDGTNLTPTWNKSSAGINTTSSVGIGTTNPRFTLEVGAVGASGTSLWVNGNARVSGILTVGSSSIVLDGNANKILVGSGISFDGNTGIISATAFYAGGSIITGGGGGGGLNYWGSSASGISTTANVAIGTVTPTSKLTVVGNSLFSGIATFRSNLTLANLTSSSNTLRFGSNSYIDQSNNDTFTFQINSGTDGSGTDSSFVFRTTEPGSSPIPDQAYDALRVYSGGNYWNRLVRVYTNFHADNNAFVGGDLQVGAASTLIGAGSTLGSFKVGAGGTVITTTSTGLVGIGTTNPTSKLTVNGGIQLAQNNPTIVGTSGTVGEIKRIGGAPFFYDGSAWREFVLSSGTPVTVPADTEWDNVVFRSTFDTDFTDAKFGATPVYVSAGSTIVGAAVTIGTGAFRNDGAVGSGVSYAYRSDYDFTGSWTIEFWMYVDSGPSNNNPVKPVSLISMSSTTGIGSSGNWSLAMYGDGFANKSITWFNQNHPTYNNGITLYNVSNVTWSSTILDKWNHFALVREGDNGSLHFYVNGIEQYTTPTDNIIDNDILDISANGLHFGGDTQFAIGGRTFNEIESADVIFDDVRISCGVGTAGQRYNSIGIATYATFTPPTTALPTTGTLSSYVQPPGDKYGELTLGGSPTWRGTSGVTVSQQSSGNYRVSFASTYTNANDYFVLTQAMDQGFASYVGVARSITHVDFAINRESDNSAVNSGSLSVQIKNHI
jgi:hypothetical protein